MFFFPPQVHSSNLLWSPLSWLAGGGGKGQDSAATLTPSVQSKVTFSKYGANINSSVSQHGATKSCKGSCPGPAKTRSNSSCRQTAGGGEGGEAGRLFLLQREF